MKSHNFFLLENGERAAHGRISHSQISGRTVAAPAYAPAAPMQIPEIEPQPGAEAVVYYLFVVIFFNA